jgi:hypothetical protein
MSQKKKKFHEKSQEKRLARIVKRKATVRYGSVTFKSTRPAGAGHGILGNRGNGNG